MITVPEEKQMVLYNKLIELKVPKARMFVDIPFDYAQVKELDVVEVRMSYQDQGRFKAFVEGGHYTSWEDAGTYRFKQFYIVGMSHSKEGDYTRLRLIEKI
jgi:hypothetical protein